MQKFMTMAVEKSPDKKDVLVFRASTMAVDRDGDILVPDGVVTEHYMKNPVMLWAHDWRERLPIGKALGVKVVPGSHVEIPVQFDSSDTFAMDVKRKYENGFLNAVSVGFEPIEAEEITKGGRRTGHKFIKWELMELSGVPIPANADALLLGYKGWMEKRGLATDKEETPVMKDGGTDEAGGAFFAEGKAPGDPPPQQGASPPPQQQQQVPTAMEMLQQIHQMVTSLVDAAKPKNENEENEQTPQPQAASAEAGITKALSDLGLSKEEALVMVKSWGTKGPDQTVEDLAKKAIKERVAYMSGKSWTLKD